MIHYPSNYVTTSTRAGDHHITLVDTGIYTSLTIDGNGAVCNAQQMGTFFYLQGRGATLTLNDMALKNGLAKTPAEVNVLTFHFCCWPCMTFL
jgi:hypothetical protein